MSHQHSDEERCRLLAQVSDYVADELAPELRAALEVHLAECPNCRVVCDTLRGTAQLYRALEETPTPLPSGLAARLFQLLCD